ncbi:MAG TPA: glutathione S-transferase family protein [Polyangia bacterium]|jgi:glutathione S-transferase
MKLLIGNKNYSSWSLRSWLLLAQLEIPFEEEKLSFNDPAFKARVGEHSPAGQVPVLIDGEVVIWDSLAIAEYIAEAFPERGVWPRERAARARARSICAEIHAGFGALRDAIPMNCELRLDWAPRDLRVQRDIARIVAMWSDCRARFGAGGPFLFGTFSAADAYYAPVVRRFLGFDAALPAVAADYVATIDALPAMRDWMAAALAEHDYFGEDEPYRAPPARK